VFDYASNQDAAERLRLINFTFSQKLSRFLYPLLGIRDIEEDGAAWSLSYYYIILMCKIIKVQSYVLMSNALFMALRPYFCLAQCCGMNSALFYLAMFAYFRRLDVDGEACVAEADREKLWYSLDKNLYDDSELYKKLVEKQLLLEFFRIFCLTSFIFLEIGGGRYNDQRWWIHKCLDCGCTFGDAEGRRRGERAFDLFKGLRE
jgi:hypothetical protein